MGCNTIQPDVPKGLGEAIENVGANIPLKKTDFAGGKASDKPRNMAIETAKYVSDKPKSLPMQGR